MLTCEWVGADGIEAIDWKDVNASRTDVNRIQIPFGDIVTFAPTDWLPEYEATHDFYQKWHSIL